MKYTAVELAELLAKDYGKTEEEMYFLISNRFRSKYANRRWGVERTVLPDNSIKKVVPEEKLHLWDSDTLNSYRGRPTF